MMTHSFDLFVATDEKILFEGKVLSLYIPGKGGDMELLAHHADIFSLIREGQVRIVSEMKKVITLTTKSGILEMKANHATLLLSDQDQTALFTIQK